MSKVLTSVGFFALFLLFIGVIIYFMCKKWFNKINNIRELFLNNVLLDLNTYNLKYDQTYGTSDFEFISWNSFKYIKNTDSRPVINSIINSRPSQVYIDIYDNSSIISNNILVFDLMKEINFIYKLKLSSFKNKIFYTEITQENTNIKENLNQLDYINLYLNNNSIFLKLKNKDISNSEIIFNYNLGTILNENEWFVLQIKLKPNINTIGTIYIQTTYNYILEVYKNGDILGYVNVNFPYSYNIESYKNISKMYLQTTNIGIYNTSALNPSFSLSSVYITNSTMSPEDIKFAYNKLMNNGTLDPNIQYDVMKSTKFNFDINDLRIIGTSSLSNTNNIIYDYNISLPEQEIYFSDKFYNDDTLSNWMERTRSVIGNNSLNAIQMLCSHDTCSYSISEPTYSTSNIIEQNVIPIYVSNINKILRNMDSNVYGNEFTISFLSFLTNYLNYTCNLFPYYADISNIKFTSNKLCNTLNRLINNIKEELILKNITNTNSVEKFIKGILGSWSITQNISLTEQLNKGIRYIELKLFADRNEGLISSYDLTLDSIIVSTSFLSTSLKFNDVIDTINTWLQTNSKEILILDFKDLTNITNSSIDTFMLVSPFDKRNELQKGILDKIKNTFGNKLSPNNIFPDQTYNQFINSGYRIMVCFPNNEILDEDNKKFVDRWKNNYNWINNRSEKILNTGKEIFTTIPNTLWYKTNEYISSNEWSIQYNIQKFIVLDSYGGIENLVQSELENLIINGMVNSSKLLQPKNLKELSLQFTNSFIYGCLPSPYNIDTMKIKISNDKYNFISVDHFNCYNINSILVSLYKNELEQYVSLSKNTNEDSQCFLKDNQCYSKIGYKNDSCIKLYNCNNENETCYPICKSIDYSEPKISEYQCLRRRPTLPVTTLSPIGPNDPKFPSQTMKQYSLTKGKNINTIISTFFDLTENIYEMESSSETTVTKFYKKRNDFVLENTLSTKSIFEVYKDDYLILGGNQYNSTKKLKYGLYDPNIIISTYNSYFGSGINLILSYQGKLFLCDNYFNTIWNDTEPVPNIYDPRTVNTANKNISKPKKKITIFKINNFNNCILIDTIENESYKVESQKEGLYLKIKLESSKLENIYFLKYYINTTCTDSEQTDIKLYFCYHENLFILSGLYAYNIDDHITCETKYGLKNINKNKNLELIFQGKNIYLTLTDYGDLLIIDDDNNRLWSMAEECILQNNFLELSNEIITDDFYKTSEINIFDYPLLNINGKNMGIPSINNYLHIWGKNFYCKENCVMVNELSTSHCIILKRNQDDITPALTCSEDISLYENATINIIFYYSSNGTLLNFLNDYENTLKIKIFDNSLSIAFIDQNIPNIFTNMLKNQFYKLVISISKKELNISLTTYNKNYNKYTNTDIYKSINIFQYLKKITLFSDGLTGGLCCFNLFDYKINSNIMNIIDSYSQDLYEIPTVSYYEYDGIIKYFYSSYKNFSSFITFGKQNVNGEYTLFELYYEENILPSLCIYYIRDNNSNSLKIKYVDKDNILKDAHISSDLVDTLNIYFLKFEYSMNKITFIINNEPKKVFSIQYNIKIKDYVPFGKLLINNFLLIENYSMNIKTHLTLNELQNIDIVSGVKSWNDFNMNDGKIQVLNDINKNGKIFYYVYTDNKKYLIKNNLFLVDLSSSITFVMNFKLSSKDVYSILSKFITLFSFINSKNKSNLSFGIQIEKSYNIAFVIGINGKKYAGISNLKLIDIKNWSKLSINMYYTDSNSINIDFLFNDNLSGRINNTIDITFYTFDTCEIGKLNNDNINCCISKVYFSSGFLFSKYNSYNSNTIDYSIPNKEIKEEFPELVKDFSKNYLVTNPDINNVSISLTGNGTLSLYFFIGIYRGLNSLSFRNSEEYCSTSDMGSIFYAIYSFYKTSTKACDTQNIYEWIEDRLLGENCDINSDIQLQSYNSEKIKNYPSFYELIQDYVNNPRTKNLNWKTTLNELFLNKVNLSDNNPIVLNSIQKSVFLSQNKSISNLYFLPIGNPFWLCNSQITSKSIYNNIYTITPLYSGTKSEIKGLKQFSPNDSCIYEFPIIDDGLYLSTVTSKTDNLYNIKSNIGENLVNVTNIPSNELYYNKNDLSNEINDFYINKSYIETSIQNNIIYDVNKILNISSNKENIDIELECKKNKICDYKMYKVFTNFNLENKTFTYTGETTEEIHHMFVYTTNVEIIITAYKRIIHWGHDFKKIKTYYNSDIPVKSLGYFPGNLFFLAGFSDGKILKFDIMNGDILNSYTYSSLVINKMLFIFIDENSLLIYLENDKSLKILDISNNYNIISVFKNKQYINIIKEISNYIYFGTTTGKIFFTNKTNIDIDMKNSFYIEESIPINDLEYLEDKKILVVCTDNFFQVWSLDLDYNVANRIISIDGITNFVVKTPPTSAQPKSSFITINNSEIKFWNLETNSTVSNILTKTISNNKGVIGVYITGKNLLLGCISDYLKTDNKNSSDSFVNSFNLNELSYLDPLCIYSLLSRGVKKIFCFTTIHEDITFTLNKYLNTEIVDMNPNIIKNYFKDPIYKVFDDTSNNSILNSIYSFLKTTYDFKKECPTYVKIRLSTVPNIYLNIKAYELELFLIVLPKTENNLTVNSNIFKDYQPNYIQYNLKDMNILTSYSSNMITTLKKQINNFYLNSSITKPEFNFDLLDYCTYLIYKKESILINNVNIIYTKTLSSVDGTIVDNKLNGLPSIYKIVDKKDITLNYTFLDDDLWCYANTVGMVFEIPKQDVLKNDKIFFELYSKPYANYVLDDIRITFSISIDKDLEKIILKVNKITSFIYTGLIFKSLVGKTSDISCELPFIIGTPIILFARYDENYLSLNMYWTYNNTTYNTNKTVRFETYCFKALETTMTLGSSYNERKTNKYTTFKFYISELIVYVKHINDIEYLNLKNHLLKKWNFKNIITNSPNIMFNFYIQDSSKNKYFLKNFASITNNVLNETQLKNPLNIPNYNKYLFLINKKITIGNFYIEKGFTMVFSIKLVEDTCKFFVFDSYLDVYYEKNKGITVSIDVYNIVFNEITSLKDNFIISFNIEKNSIIIQIIDEQKLHTYKRTNNIPYFTPFKNNLSFEGQFILYEYLFFNYDLKNTDIRNILINLYNNITKESNILKLNPVLNFDMKTVKTHTNTNIVSKWENSIDNKLALIPSLVSAIKITNSKRELLPIGVKSLSSVNIKDREVMTLNNEINLTQCTVALVIEINTYNFDKNSVLFFIGKIKDNLEVTIKNTRNLVLKNGDIVNINTQNYDFSDTLTLSSNNHGKYNLPKINFIPLILFVRIGTTSIYFEQTTSTNKVPKINRIEKTNNTLEGENILCVGGIQNFPETCKNDIKVSQIMVYDTAISDYEIAILRSHLSSKWKFYD